MLTSHPSIIHLQKVFDHWCIWNPHCYQLSRPDWQMANVIISVNIYWINPSYESLTALDLNLAPLMKAPCCPQNCSDFQSPCSPTVEEAVFWNTSCLLKQDSWTPLREESSRISPWSGSTLSLNPLAQVLSGQNDSCPQSPQWLLAVGWIWDWTGRDTRDWGLMEAPAHREASEAGG